MSTTKYMFANERNKIHRYGAAISEVGSSYLERLLNISLVMCPLSTLNPRPLTYYCKGDRDLHKSTEADESGQID